MNWTRNPGGWQDADSGHRVLAIRRGDAWVFWALGPDRMAGWDYRAWSNGRIPHWSGREPPEHYARGMHILERREFIGESPDAETARRMCEDHAAQRAA